MARNRVQSKNIVGEKMVCSLRVKTVINVEVFNLSEIVGGRRRWRVRSSFVYRILCVLPLRLPFCVTNDRFIYRFIDARALK